SSLLFAQVRTVGWSKRRRDMVAGAFLLIALAGMIGERWGQRLVEPWRTLLTTGWVIAMLAGSSSRQVRQTPTSANAGQSDASRAQSGCRRRLPGAGRAHAQDAPGARRACQAPAPASTHPDLATVACGFL